MSKRKATLDIHPNAIDENPVTSRLKIGDTEVLLTYGSSPLEKSSTHTATVGCSETPGLLSRGSETKSTTSCDVGTIPSMELLIPKLPEHAPLKPQNATSKDASLPESGLAKEEIAVGSQWDCDPTTMRSRYFMKNMAELNQSFAIWISSCIKEDPTAILTRVFIDHQRQAQALFDEERDHTVDLDKLLVLQAQEKVLHQLKEADEDDASTSNSSVASNNDSAEEMPLINGAEAAKEEHPISMASSDVSSPNTVPLKQTFNPFLNNNALNGMKPVTLTSKDTDQVAAMVKDTAPKPAEAVAEKPVNFGSFSFASACSEAAAKAAAARDQESEETNDDTPPKVEFTPVQEEGAVYTKRCKIFFKKEKEEGYEDRGIGNLFVKPVVSNNRHQLIVRSETSLGNLLVNVLLSPDIPVRKMGDKNVMLVMVPTPGSALRTVMVRMKDGADEVVEMLTKYSTI